MSPINYETDVKDRNNLLRKTSIAASMTKHKKFSLKVMKNLQTDRKGNFHRR